MIHLNRLLHALLSTLILLHTFHASVAMAETTFELTGTLQVGTFFGPPNYGEQPESDSIERSFYVQLRTPLILPDDRSAQDEDMGAGYFVQLVFPSKKLDEARSLVGKDIRLRGTLFEAVNAHHRTPWVMDVADFEALVQPEVSIDD